MLAKITLRTLPQRAASLRLTEEGKRLLESGQYAKALDRLEKTLGVDSTNPYVYYYLAKAHYHLAHYRQSLDFLEVAESLVSDQSYWLAKVHSLKGENFRALGFLGQANSSYVQALRLNPGNRTASEGLTHVRREMKAPSLR
ncbi:MAG: tetratricopeptide repeat protein [Candidatus Binatia bacterium]